MGMVGTAVSLAANRAAWSWKDERKTTCKSKVVFTSRDAANRRARLLSRRRGLRWYSYECPVCSSFHLSSF